MCNPAVTLVDDINAASRRRIEFLALKMLPLRGKEFAEIFFQEPQLSPLHAFAPPKKPSVVFNCVCGAAIKCMWA